ncbi:hypothetical protein G9A89_006787 [Geosiphon pyriformis]|nr:hypothetical protein G9A89_006787 [Geosiphon pyriformis]
MKFLLNANFSEYFSTKEINLSSQKDSLNITKQQKRSIFVPDPNFQKILVKDQDLLRMLANNAYYARQAACLKDNSERLTLRFFVGMPKNALVDGYHFQIWLRSKEIFWKKMKNLNLRFKSGFHFAKKYFTFTGFGRAGIIAVYAALEFGNANRIKPTVVTFGQPRMGNRKFVEFVATQITLYRVTYRDDYTPSLPTYGYTSNRIAVEYLPLSGEYWIPFQDQCECSPLFPEASHINQKINFPSVYKCYQVGTLNAHPDCNGNWIQRTRSEHRTTKKKENDDHFGPYFGYMMGKCPSESTDISTL